MYLQIIQNIFHKCDQNNVRILQCVEDVDGFDVTLSFNN